MIRLTIRQRKTRARWRVYALAPLCMSMVAALVLVSSPTPTELVETMGPPQPEHELPFDLDARTAAIDELRERKMIESMIRRHRRAANREWLDRLADAIYLESIRAELDPLLVASIVAKESSFQSRVVSHKGAVGLMQLRPWVAQDVAERFEVEWDGTQTLHRPEVNVRLGVLYYKELIERFEGDHKVALTAYNFGPTRVRKQLVEGTYRGSRYADEILRTYSRLNDQRQSAT